MKDIQCLLAVMRRFHLQAKRGEHADGHFAIQGLILDNQNAAMKAPAARRRASSARRWRSVSGVLVAAVDQSLCSSAKADRFGQFGVEQRIAAATARTQADEAQQANGTEILSQTAAHFVPKTGRVGDQCIVDHSAS